MEVPATPAPSEIWRQCGVHGPKLWCQARSALYDVSHLVASFGSDSACRSRLRVGYADPKASTRGACRARSSLNNAPYCVLRGGPEERSVRSDHAWLHCAQPRCDGSDGRARQSVFPVTRSPCGRRELYQWGQGETAQGRRDRRLKNE